MTGFNHGKTFNRPCGQTAIGAELHIRKPFLLRKASLIKVSLECTKRMRILTGIGNAMKAVVLAVVDMQLELEWLAQRKCWPLAQLRCLTDT